MDFYYMNNNEMKGYWLVVVCLKNLEGRPWRGIGNGPYSTPLCDPSTSHLQT